MAKVVKKKSAKEASNTFHNIMAAAVKGNPKTEKTGSQILFEIGEAVKKLNKKYPKCFVMDGLETQIRAGFIYHTRLRHLAYTLNPNWPTDIIEDVKKTIIKTAAENSVTIITTPF